MFPGVSYASYQRSGLANAVLTETSPVQSFTEPITLAQAKAFLNLPARWPLDSAEDALISGMISGARAVAELYQQIDLVVKQWDYTFNYWPVSYYEPLRLRDPLISVDLVRRRDSTGAYTDLEVDTHYLVDTSQHPGILTPPFGQTWDTYVPWPSSSLLVRFTSGIPASSAFWNDVGGQIRNGMLLLISAWYNNRLPYEPGMPTIAEYPFGITNLLSWGARNGGVRV